MRLTTALVLGLGVIALACGGPNRTKSTGLPLSGSSSSTTQDAGSMASTSPDAGEGTSGPADAGEACTFGFKAPVSYAADGAAETLVTADFNHDGHPDIATIDHNDVSVYFGHGDGTLSNPTVFGVGGYSLDVGDFNGDGYADLAIATFPADSIQILLNQGDGTFAVGPSISLTVTTELEFATADLNGDGLADVIVNAGYPDASPSGLFIYLSAGNGTFAAPITYPNVSGYISVADMNGDGQADIVITAYGSTGAAGITILFNQGNGTFGPPQTFSTPNICNGYVVLANLTGSSALDSVGTCENAGGSTGEMTVSLEEGGTWTTPTVYLVDSPTNETNPVDSASNPAVADFNGDGKLDVIVSDTFDPVMDLFLGNGDGTFQMARRISLPAPVGTLASVDLNGDGWPDLVVGDSGGLAVLLNNGCN